MQLGTTVIVTLCDSVVTVGTDAAVVHVGTMVCVQLSPSTSVGVLDAVVQLGTVTSVNPIAKEGMLDAVTQEGTIVSVCVIATVGTLAAVVVLGTVVCVHECPPAVRVGVLAAVVHEGTVVIGTF